METAPIHDIWHCFSSRRRALLGFAIKQTPPKKSRGNYNVQDTQSEVNTFDLSSSKNKSLNTICKTSTHKKQNGQFMRCFLTLRDPILTEQEFFLWKTGVAVLLQTGAEGQSPQEHPSEVSPQE